MSQGAEISALQLEADTETEQGMVSLARSLRLPQQPLRDLRGDFRNGPPEG
jgi:hypothetical protein